MSILINDFDWFSECLLNIYLIFVFVSHPSWWNSIWCNIIYIFTWFEKLAYKTFLHLHHCKGVSCGHLHMHTLILLGSGLIYKLKIHAWRAAHRTIQYVFCNMLIFQISSFQRVEMPARYLSANKLYLKIILINIF